MARTTIRDVADEAGVGTATVERVINARGGVRPETVTRVIKAAKKLGYDHRLPDAHRGAIRIEVMLVRPETSFYSRLNTAFEQIAATLDKTILVHRTFVRENDPEGVARHIAQPSFPRSALIVVAPDHPLVTESLLAERDRGVEVVQIVTRATDAISYVGIDNYAAGRTAGFYMGSMLSERPGTIVALCHSGAYQNHRERIRGFSDYLQSGGRHLFSEVIFTADDQVLTVRLLRDALRRYPDLIGIYTAGGDNLPVAEVLTELARPPFWVGHEFNEQSRHFLANGLMMIVLDQAPEVQARRSLDKALAALGLLTVKISDDPVRFMTICRENS